MQQPMEGRRASWERRQILRGPLQIVVNSRRGHARGPTGMHTPSGSAGGIAASHSGCRSTAPGSCGCEVAAPAAAGEDLAAPLLLDGEKGPGESRYQLVDLFKLLRALSAERRRSLVRGRSGRTTRFVDFPGDEGCEIICAQVPRQFFNGKCDVQASLQTILPIRPTSGNTDTEFRPGLREVCSDGRPARALPKARREWRPQAERCDPMPAYRRSRCRILGLAAGRHMRGRQGRLANQRTQKCGNCPAADVSETRCQVVFAPTAPSLGAGAEPLAREKFAPRRPFHPRPRFCRRPWLATERLAPFPRSPTAVASSQREPSIPLDFFVASHRCVGTWRGGDKSTTGRPSLPGRPGAHRRALARRV